MRRDNREISRRLGTGRMARQAHCIAATTAIVAFWTACEARADESGWMPDVDATRVSVAGTGAISRMYRTDTQPDSRTTLGFGGEAHLHPHSPSGALLGFSRHEGIFGPKVDIIDVGYSLRFAGSPRLRGVTYAAYFDIGPVLAFVRDVQPAPDHDVLAFRTSLALDVQLGNFTLGLVGGYRGGAPLGGPQDKWEGAASIGARVGVVFDAR